LFFRWHVSRECRASFRAWHFGRSFPDTVRQPGKGLSSPTVNVVWALGNLVVGYILFHVGKVSSGDNLAVIIFFTGIVAISTMSSVRFRTKQAK
jgi:hypothetical protein